jgi:hypothetical protein
LDRRLGGLQSRSRRGVEEKNSQHYPCWELSSECPACSLVSVLTELLRPDDDDDDDDDNNIIIIIIIITLKLNRCFN